VAGRLGVGRETVRRWLVRADVDAGSRPGASSDEQAEIKRLRAENRRLREDNEILRAATVFFASNAILSGARRGSLVSSLPRGWMACPRCAALPGARAAWGVA
jgi:transposase